MYLARLPALPMLVLTLGCGGSSTSNPGGVGGSFSATGGTGGGSGAGGSDAGTGGSGSTGGSGATGGSAATGGTAATGGSAATGGNGGVGGSEPCVGSTPCSEPGSTCLEAGPCPCQLECRSGQWEYSVCPGCVVPECPEEVPEAGEACDDFQGGCEWNSCPEPPWSQASCNRGRWVVNDWPCNDSGCCESDEECGDALSCVSTICKRPIDGCWSHDDCDPGTVCGGAFVCPCNADCAPDRSGVCVPFMGDCCIEDTDCPDSFSCVNGVCKEPLAEAGACWSSTDCGAEGCSGASVCPCGTACLVEDTPGQCG